MMLLFGVMCAGALAGPRDDVVNYAWQIWNYTWTTNSTVPRYNYDPRNGPATVTGTIRGVPYTYANMVSFSEYKALSATDKGTVYSSNSMKYGMVCATLVTDCIRQGFPSRNLPLLNMVMFHKSRNSGSYTGLISSVSDAVFNYDHTQAQWQNIWANIRTSQANSGYPAYKKLQKGDYLNDWNHVILVVENDTSAQRITYIDQTICWDNVSNGMVGTHKGTYYYSDLSNKCYVPMYVNYDEVPPDLSDINPGLRRLTSNSYAKVYTLTSGKYNVYSDSNLTTRLSSSAWTGEEDEDWILGVGKNSNGVVYARISYPVGSSRQTAYVNLSEVFVPGTLKDDPKTAVVRHYGLYKRRDSGQNNDYGIDVGDSVYLLTKDNGWAQVLYPVGSLWRIAWLTERNYNMVVGIGTVEAPKITTTSLPDAYIGETYYAKINTTGTTPIYFQGGTAVSLPNGFDIQRMLVGSDTSGIIRGTPKNVYNRSLPYTLPFPVTVTNSAGSDSKNFTITVRSRPTGTPPTISSGTVMPEATKGRPYSQTLTATGTTPITWSVYDASLPLPPGLTLSTSGTISGTPTTAGRYTFRVKITNSAGWDAKLKTIKVNLPPVLNGTFKNGTVGTYYSEYVTVSEGTESFTWAKTSGTIPDGLSFSPSGRYCYLKGTPTTAGTYYFTLGATDQNGATATKSYTVTIQPRASLTISWTFKNGTVGTSYSDWVSVSGGTAPYTWSKESGTLPDGLSLSPSGTYCYLKGTPTNPGTYHFKLKVVDTNGAEGTKSFSVVIKPATLTISWTFKNGTVGTSYSDWVSVSGGTAPYTWSKESGTLPDGLSLSPSGTYCYLKGTPTTAGTYYFKLKVVDTNGAEGTKDFMVTISPEQTAPLTISYTFKKGFRKGYYLSCVAASGGSGSYTWRMVSGTIPNGLKTNQSGRYYYLRGTPIKAGTFKFTLKLSDSAGHSLTCIFTVKITQTTVSGKIASTLTRKAWYSKTLTASGGTAPYTWSVSSGKLPDGLKLKASTGKISGTLTKAGKFTFTIKAKDKNGAAGTKKYTITVTQTTVSGKIAASLPKNTSYSKTLKASGGASPYTWTVSSGQLPTGLKLGKSSGKISGTPSKEGTYTFTIKAKDKNGAAGTKKYTVKVTAASAANDALLGDIADNPSADIPAENTTGLPATPESPGTLEALPANPAGTLSLSATLSVASDDVLEAGKGRDSDLITVMAGKPVTFILGDWGVEVSGVTVMIDDKPAEGITISDDGTFTLKAELVTGDFKVCVKATHNGSELESETLYIISQ